MTLTPHPSARLTVVTVLAVVVAAMISPLARCGEWTRFRGPNGSGLSDDTSVPTSWTEDGYKWKIAIPGRGHAHPVFWENRAFQPTATEEGKKRVLLCLEADSGRTLWSKTFDMPTHRKHRLNSYASSTPAVEANRVYVSFGTPEQYVVTALDHAGEIIWSRDFGPFSANHGHASSPIIVEDMLIVQNDNDEKSFVVAVDKKTGDTRWKTDRRSAKASYSTPCVRWKEGGAPEIVVNSQAHGIAVLDARTGDPRWEAPVFALRTCSSPVISEGGLVFGTCGSGGGGNTLAAMRFGGSGDVSATHLAFKLEHSIPYVPTPVVKGDRIYLWNNRGIVSCYRASRGGEPIWRRRVDGTYFSSPICVGDRLYNASVEGEVVVVAAADEFRELARNPIGDGTHTTPAVHDGRLYVRTFSHLICIGK